MRCQRVVSSTSLATSERKKMLRIGPRLIPQVLRLSQNSPLMLLNFLLLSKQRMKRPNFSCYPSSHCWRHAQRGMDTHKIIVREVQSASRFQVRQLLRESVSQASESAHRHSHGEVLPLDVRCADVFRVGPAVSNLGYDLHDWAWGVAFISGLPDVAKEFD
jgi:hypothetical protein